MATSSSAASILGTLLLLAVLPASAGETAAARLGRRIFFDASLSASGRMSCASCHDPAHAYGPPNGLAVQLGGPGLDRQGTRAVPSLRYTLDRTPVWSAPYAASEVERLLDGEPPAGGFGWDGRFNSLREQADFPLLSSSEMANPTRAALVARLERARYAADFRRLFGRRVFDHPERAYRRALFALERFELEDSSFHPYTSRFDAYLDGNAALSAQELHGMALFDDPRRGNCASCHPDRPGADGSHPLFTDFQFEALGVPRNPQIRATAARGYFDQGLCGPLRRDQRARTQYCGMFKTPTLRNAASRCVFFHNGRFHDLRAALRFYVRRDTDPRLWYPASALGVVKFDDLPPRRRLNVDIIDLPLNRSAGQQPVWSDTEIDDVIAFLATLSDSDTRTCGP
ncbi:MAG TPA: cytochrome c peroxidase [Steroidobacteraceae bacterium]